MIVRYGFYEGHVAPDDRAAFDAIMGHEVMPALAEMPGVAEVRLLRGTTPAGLVPTYYQLIELSFADDADLYRAMNSPQRRGIGPVQVPSIPMFRGRTPHANFEVTTRLAGRAV